MLTQFELTFTRRSTQGKIEVKNFYKIEGEDLVEVLSKLLIAMAQMNQDMINERFMDDDIPF